MPGEQDAGGTVHAAEPLAVELMNTIGADHGEVRDKLADTADVASWLRGVADLMTPTMNADAATRLARLLDGADEDTLARLGQALRDLRAPLRHLAAAVTDDPRPPITAPDLSRSAATASLNGFLTTSPELVWLADGQPSLAYRSHDSMADLVVGLIAHQGVDLLGGPRRRQLRACVAPNCDRFFVKDHPRREWCSAVCGNRARVARHYQRRHPVARTSRRRKSGWQSMNGDCLSDVDDRRR